MLVQPTVHHAPDVGGSAQVSATWVRGESAESTIVRSIRITLSLLLLLGSSLPVRHVEIPDQRVRSVTVHLSCPVALYERPRGPCALIGLLTASKRNDDAQNPMVRSRGNGDRDRPRRLR